MFNKYLKIPLIIFTLSIFGCKDESNVFTLYRNSPLDREMRIHTATFDSEDKSYGGTSETLNRENCQLAASLFQAQRGVVSTFWCERSYFKK